MKDFSLIPMSAHSEGNVEWGHACQVVPSVNKLGTITKSPTRKTAACRAEIGIGQRSC